MGSTPHRRPLTAPPAAHIAQAHGAEANTKKAGRWAGERWERA